MPHRPPLHWSLRDEVHRERLHLIGELDMTAGPVLREAMSQLTAGRALVVDLSGITFADTHGLAALRDELAKRPNGSVKVIHLPARMRRLVRLRDQIRGEPQPA